MTDWEDFEKKVRDTLGLEPTINSGNKWYDISDGVHRDSNPYRVMVDAKCTEGQSFMLHGKLLQQWFEEATKLGYKFALPFKMSGLRATPDEWVAIPLEDYAELVETIRRLSANKKEQSEDLELISKHILSEPLSDDIVELIQAMKRVLEVLNV